MADEALYVRIIDTRSFHLNESAASLLLELAMETGGGN